jgi:hypothetical protein
MLLCRYLQGGQPVVLAVHQLSFAPDIVRLVVAFRLQSIRRDFVHIFILFLMFGITVVHLHSEG